MSPEARASGSDDARRDWYRSAIAGDAQKRDRFARNLERARSTEGTPDTLESLDRLLAAE